VSRSRVAWWPDSGATTSTTGSALSAAMVAASSLKRLNRTSRQKGLRMTSCSSTGTTRPSTSTSWMFQGGFS